MMVCRCGFALVLLTCVSAAATAINVTELDCQMRQLAFRKARSMQPWRDPLTVFRALELEQLCGRAPPRRRRQQAPALARPAGIDFFVDPSIKNGIHGALEQARAHSNKAAPKNIVLKEGIHYINKTIILDQQDDGTTITNEPGKEAWISGGYFISKDLPWVKHDNIHSVKLDSYPDHDPKGDLFSGLFTVEPHERMTRARYPNANVERTQWGPYSSDKDLKYSIDGSKVDLWWKPPEGGPLPHFVSIDLSKPNKYGAIKNDSAMKSFNNYGTGVGGVCDTVWTPGEPSYWCSNISDGGLARFDRACAMRGQLQLPVGMTYNGHDEQLKRFVAYKNATGAILHAWHSLSWHTNMFEVASHKPASFELSFSRGGQQATRNWYTCDQTAAAPWCGQRKSPPVNDTRLFSGTWYIENVIEELDHPSEFYFDKATKTLYFWPNSTLGLTDMTTPVLKRLISIQGASSVTIQGVGLRDAAATFMDDWAAPSGGDWALHRGGAVFIENAINVTITNCFFRRVDGNALFLSRRARNIVIQKSEFAWIGDSAMATWGDTDGADATQGKQPRGTVVKDNFIHEIGLYDKQSSGWGQAKTCQTLIQNNIMFNMPRAAINFNDNMGGANTIVGNLIWNTCRESNDHGPINTWDRMPFLHDLDVTPTFASMPTLITKNFVIANYGGAQGVDNDDGSSHYHIHDNVFYMADGFKMDYGGHDSKFWSNLVVTFPFDGQNCMNVDSFLPGRGHSFFNNTCLVGLGGKMMPPGCSNPSCAQGPAKQLNHITSQRQCSEDFVHTHDNRFYTPDGSSSMVCGNATLSLQEAQRQFGVEPGSTSLPYPSAETVVEWALGVLGMQDRPAVVQV